VTDYATSFSFPIDTFEYLGSAASSISRRDNLYIAVINDYLGENVTFTSAFTCPTSSWIVLDQHGVVTNSDTIFGPVISVESDSEGTAVFEHSMQNSFSPTLLFGRFTSPPG
jgi:hypothetical protein